MARWDVTGFTSGASTVTTHASLPLPRVLISLGPGSSDADTTKLGVAGFALGSADSTVGLTGQSAAGYAASYDSSGIVEVQPTGTFLEAWTTTAAVGALLSGIASTSLSRSDWEVDPAPRPVGIVAGGGDVSVFRATTGLSTLASTQASTGYGFQPNAAIVLGYSTASSVANLSIGFTCQTSDGTIKQWCIDQAGRASGNAEVHKSASTVSVLKLHTTNTTAHDVSVTSFNSDGLELTVNATDTARAAVVSVLGLNVPRADAGKATITTNGAGAGQTGVTVTGLGQNVGLVLLASIGSSLQTLQADNRFSVGFASSNNNQRCVSGYVQNGGSGTSHYASYFGTSHAVIFTSANGGSSGAVVKSKGVFAATTDGFTVTFDSTTPNGYDLYWGAFMNTVTDLECHILSSGTVSANLQEVTRLSAQILSSAEVSASLLREFETNRTKVAAKAEIKTDIRSEKRYQGDDTDDAFYNVVENSTSPDFSKNFDITTSPQALGLAGMQNARHVTILPPSTNTHPMRLAGSLQSPGIPVSSRGMNSFPVPEDAGQELYLRTTESTSIPEVRVLIR